MANLLSIRSGTVTLAEVIARQGRNPDAVLVEIAATNAKLEACVTAMKLKFDIDPDIVAMMASEVAAGERAVTAAMREAGTGLKTAWRLQISGAGLGTLDPKPELPEVGREPRRGSTGLVQGSGHRRRA